MLRVSDAIQSDLLPGVHARDGERNLALPHSVEAENVPMGLHDLGAEMHSHLQERINQADVCGYDAILLGYAVCGRGTEGLRAGKTQLVLPRVHDCIGLLMGGPSAYQSYFENHPGVYFRSPARSGSGGPKKNWLLNMARRTASFSSSSSMPIAGTTPG